jgi:hypothetical protein
MFRYVGNCGASATRIAYFAIANISGYTSFLAGSNLTIGDERIEFCVGPDNKVSTLRTLGAVHRQ